MLSPKNKVHLEGYLYLVEDKTKYYPGEQGGKKSFMIAKIKVPRFGSDKEGKKVYDYHKFKAFGSNADFIHNYCENGEPVSLDGELQVEDNTLNDDGTVKYYGQPIVVIDVVEKCLRKYEENGTSSGQPVRAGRPAVAPAPQPTFTAVPSFGSGAFGSGFSPQFNPANLKAAN